MWLNGRRVTEYGLARDVREAIVNLYPDGVKMSKKTVFEIEKYVAALGTEAAPRSVDWMRMASSTLTGRAYRDFETRVGRKLNETTIERQARYERAHARYLNAVARWRVQYRIQPSSFVHPVAAREAVRPIEEAWRKAQQANDVENRKVRRTVFIEMLQDDANTRTALRTQPRSMRQPDGTVLVTSQTLRRLGSCDTYVDRFHDSWPNGTVITKELCVNNADRFDWGWAAGHLLAPNLYDRWVNNADAISEAASQRLRALDRQLNERLNGIQNLSLTDRQRRTKERQIYDGYNDARAPLVQERDVAMASAFGDLYAEHPNPTLPDLGD